MIKFKQGFPKITVMQCVAWIGDLRSGKFKQGTGTLKRSTEVRELVGRNGATLDKIVDEWCCIGLLEKVVNPPGHVVENWRGSAIICPGYPGTKETAWRADYILGMSEVALPWITNPAITSNYSIIQNFLAAENDRGTTFYQISDWLETEYLPALRDYTQRTHTNA